MVLPIFLEDILYCLDHGWAWLFYFLEHLVQTSDCVGHERVRNFRLLVGLHQPMELTPSVFVLQAKRADMGIHTAQKLLSVILLHVSEICVPEQLLGRRYPTLLRGFAVGT